MLAFPLAPAHGARLLAQALKNLGDKPGHEFHGNQWTLPRGIADTPENRSIKWEKRGAYYVNAEPLTLYHGTSESRTSVIQNEGLKYGNLATTPEYAAKIAAIRREGEQPVVFQVDAPARSIYPVFHGPKGVKTDALALAKPITAIRVLGGPGSGNFGHEGRPGEVGGSGSALAEHVKFYSVVLSTGQAIARVSGAIIRGESTNQEYMGTEKHLAAAHALIQAIRDAPEQEIPLYRAVAFWKTSNESAHRFQAQLHNLKIGDTMALDRLSSFSEDRTKAAFYANTGKPKTLAKNNEANYELRIEGPVKAIATDQYSGLHHQERITQGKFEVIAIESGSRVRLEDSYVGKATYEKTIVLRQVGVF